MCGKCNQQMITLLNLTLTTIGRQVLTRSKSCVIIEVDKGNRVWNYGGYGRYFWLKNVHLYCRAFFKKGIPDIFVMEFFKKGIPDF